MLAVCIPTTGISSSFVDATQPHESESKMATRRKTAPGERKTKREQLSPLELSLSKSSSSHSLRLLKDKGIDLHGFEDMGID
jgi:hypothetical protein